MALNRKPKQRITSVLQLDDETKIEFIDELLVGQSVELAKQKNKLSEEEFGVEAIASKVLVNGEAITGNDLKNCFTQSEFEKIAEWFQSCIPEEVLEEAKKNVLSPATT